MASRRSRATGPSGGHVTNGRGAQRRRTRQALLDAGNELLDEGGRPSLEEVAERADVSRATAYRYFPSVDALLTDALVDRSIVSPGELFDGGGGDLVDRLLAVEEAVNGPLAADEVAMHVISRLLADEWLASGDGDRAERPGRRMPLIEEAIAPHRASLGDARADRLRDAVALAVGTEAVITLRDVCRLSHRRARDTARHAITTLACAALDEVAEEA